MLCSSITFTEKRHFGMRATLKVRECSAPVTRFTQSPVTDMNPPKYVWTLWLLKGHIKEMDILFKKVDITQCEAIDSRALTTDSINVSFEYSKSLRQMWQLKLWGELPKTSESRGELGRVGQRTRLSSFWWMSLCGSFECFGDSSAQEEDEGVNTFNEALGLFLGLHEGKRRRGVCEVYSKSLILNPEQNRVSSSSPGGDSRGTQEERRPS